MIILCRPRAHGNRVLRLRSSNVAARSKTAEQLCVCFLNTLRHRPDSAASETRRANGAMNSHSVLFATVTADPPEMKFQVVST
jgi:hypothetical protein